VQADVSEANVKPATRAAGAEIVHVGEHRAQPRARRCFAPMLRRGKGADCR